MKITIPADYFDTMYERLADPDFYAIDANPELWDDVTPRLRRQAAERRWGFYSVEPLPTKPRNRHRPLVRTFTGE